MRSLHTAAKSSPHSPQLEKAHTQQRRPNAAKNKNKNKINKFIKKKKKKKTGRDFPGGAVVKNLPASAGTWVWSLVWEDPTCRRATKPVSHNYWSLCATTTEARAPQLLSMRSRAREPQLLSPRATTTEACMPRARVPQQEKPPQWETRAPQGRIAPAHSN